MGSLFLFTYICNMSLQPSYTIKEATHKLEQYCAYQERCHKEVTKKLKDMGMIADARDLIITHLIKENYLNEERFAQSFARGKFNIKKWGKNRIVNELKFRDISIYNIKTALKEIDEDQYIQTLNELASKRANEVKETNIYKKRKKIADYLLYRGWESHLVYEKVQELTPKK
ncbi:regulatory protein [Cellulophaga sp. RHA_52]|uniref:Regulatory protein RecX n=2 Tax=Cellulophaga TaxID=104264 RepID=F0REQ4_CELLC|nr:regulatory protein RecX [Cellulophaga lytica DSM 7489]TVZ08573.1 regulatory protein [Cellulophaga sp. RHA_52]